MYNGFLSICNIYWLFGTGNLSSNTVSGEKGVYQNLKTIAVVGLWLNYCMSSHVVSCVLLLQASWACDCRFSWVKISYLSLYQSLQLNS